MRRGAWFNPKWVRGRTIVDIQMNTEIVEGVRCHKPAIILDNGSRIICMGTEMPDGSDYAVDLIYNRGGD